MSDPESNRHNELVAFVEIEQAGSIAGAARILQKHPTILSKRLTALETRLGARLIERTTRQIHLTEAGRRLLDKVRTALDIIDDAETEASSNAMNITGHLKIALPGAMGRLWLAPLVPVFMTRYPAITMEIDYNDRFVDMVAEGYDVGLRVGVLKNSGLIARKLSDHRRILVASPEYIARNGTPQSPRALLDHSCLLLSRFHSHPAWHFARSGEEERIVLSGRLTSNDSEALLCATLQGDGIMAAGDWLFARDISAGRLVQVLSDWNFDAEGVITIVRPSKKHPPARTDVFVDWMVEAFADGAPWSSTVRS